MSEPGRRPEDNGVALFDAEPAQTGAKGFLFCLWFRLVVDKL